MGEYTSVVCDGDDCYKTKHDITSAMFAHEDSYTGWGDDDVLFVTAEKQDGYITRWQTWCEDCAEGVNLDLLEREGWKVRVPDRFQRGEVCVCSHDSEHPWGYRFEGGPLMIENDEGKRVMNPDRKQIKCDICNGEGWTKPQKARKEVAS